MTAWRNARLNSVSAGSVRREIAYLSAVLSYAVKELFVIAENPCNQLQKPSLPKARNRRISDEDIMVVMMASNLNWEQHQLKHNNMLHGLLCLLSIRR